MADRTSNYGGNLLMIFAKNRVEGKVKTRLAKDVGDEKALEIYNILLNHTCKIDHCFLQHFVLLFEMLPGRS